MVLSWACAHLVLQREVTADMHNWAPAQGTVGPKHIQGQGHSVTGLQCLGCQAEPAQGGF